MADFGTILHSYGLSTVHSDQAMGDALIKLGRQNGVNIAQWTLNANEKFRKYLAIRTHLERGAIDLPPVPHLRTDLLHVRKRVTPDGVRVVLPQTSDGRHCDFAPALMLALSRVLPEPEPPKNVSKVDDETARMREEFLKRVGAGKKDW